MPMESGFWFPAKRYGWGWGFPVRWQGWLVLALWLAGVLGAGSRYMPARPLLFLGVVAVLTFALAMVCHAKGQPPRWRWGGTRP